MPASWLTRPSAELGPLALLLWRWLLRSYQILVYVGLLRGLLHQQEQLQPRLHWELNWTDEHLQDVVSCYHLSKKFGAG